MRVVVLGAGGGVGRQAVRLAVERGHEVVAAARSLPQVPVPDVRYVELDVRDAGAVRAALQGADAVLWCVGVTKGSGGDVGRAALPAVAAACRDQGAALVTVSGAGVDAPGDRKPLGARAVSALTRLLARDVVEDKQGELAALAATPDLAWSVVRPPRLTDGERTAYVLTTDAPGPRAAAVTRAAVAAAMLDLAQERAQPWPRRAPFVVAG